jgi:aminoglycoside phosphotransferase (APT) family kinase protein
MAGLSTAARDPEIIHRRLVEWLVATEGDPTLRVSPFEHNRSSGFSNETLFFDVEADGRPAESFVLRLPPSGIGLFPSYDLEKQWRVQNILSERGLPTAAPARYEPDEGWLGKPFLVMPRVNGASPSDMSYLVKGWLFEASPAIQATVARSFADLLARIATVDVEAFVPFLARDGGTGLEAEVDWWDGYMQWAGDGSPSPLLVDAYAWLRETMPRHNSADSVVWNDARLSNVVFDPDGGIAAALDWEQASIGPAELDVSVWFATRRQCRDTMGVAADPELPGFPARADLIERIETAIGRELQDLAWHESFSMIRMGTCMTGTQLVLRRNGQHDHLFFKAALLPEWTLQMMGAGR